MNAQSSRHHREGDRIADALRAPLPPARPATDPAVLWACGRHARRISTEAKISLVLTAAQVSALVGVLGVLVSFVDWRAIWSASTDVLRTDPLIGAYAAMAVLATGALAWTSRVLLRKT